MQVGFIIGANELVRRADSFTALGSEGLSVHLSRDTASRFLTKTLAVRLPLSASALFSTLSKSYFSAALRKEDLPLVIVVCGHIAFFSRLNGH